MIKNSNVYQQKSAELEMTNTDLNIKMERILAII